jgi:hypothetical protein
VSETCDRQNAVQPNTQVHVAPNNTDDSTLLAQVLEDLKARTGVETLFTDGGYGSAQNDELLGEHQVTLIQTAIRGRPQDPERLHLEDFQVQMNAANEPEQLTCPKGKTGQVQACSSGEGWIAVFGEGCAACDVQHRCPVAKKKRLGGWALHFKREDLQRAERRRRLRQHQEEGRNLRAAVESTIRSIKHGFAGGKAPVRGLFRITCMVVGAVGPWSTFGGCIASGKKKYGLSRGEASKKGGRKNKSEGKSNRKMRLFFLCFEQLGHSNGYRWPYNPFNAQPSVGNVRLSAVESLLFCKTLP